jgi:hypothetical protein
VVDGFYARDKMARRDLPSPDSVCQERGAEWPAETSLLVIVGDATLLPSTMIQVENGLEYASNYCATALRMRSGRRSRAIRTAVTKTTETFPNTTA